MRFSYLLTGFILPALVFSTPTPTPEEDVLRVSMTPRAEDIFARADIKSLLDPLTRDLSGILGLLNPKTLNNIQSVVNHLALLFDDKTTNQTKSLINTAEAFPLLGQLTGLITKDFVTAIGSLIKNANNLLTPKFVSETTGLINDIAPLISAVAQLIGGLLGAILGG